MTDELKPCPFCGHDAELFVTTHKGTEHYNVSCSHCPAMTGSSILRHYVIDAWNTRYKRTCNMMAPNKETMPYPRCSACGSPMMNAPARYCAQCGSEVVDDDKR